jgi:hypothetical protein
MMGWMIGYDDRWGRDIGYGVPAACDHPGCDVEIDRGLGYVCGGEPYGGEMGCGLFFCSEHLFYSDPENEDQFFEDYEPDESHDAPLGAFVCERCRDWNERDAYEGEFKTFDPKPDIEEWTEFKATDPSWSEWRHKQPCPHDTNGDGNCGKRFCPWCGEVPAHA